MEKNLDEIKNGVFENVLKEKMEKDLDGVGQGLALFIKKYSFLFHNDSNKLLEIISTSYLNNYHENDNKFSFDFNMISQNVPQESKDKLFEKIITTYSTTVELVDIQTDTKKENEGNLNKGEIATNPDPDEILGY